MLITELPKKGIQNVVKLKFRIACSVFKLNRFKWFYDVDLSLNTDLNRFTDTLGGYDLIEQGHALVMKTHEPASQFLVKNKLNINTLKNNVNRHELMNNENSTY